MNKKLVAAVGLGVALSACTPGTGVAHRHVHSETDAEFTYTDTAQGLVVRGDIGGDQTRDVFWNPNSTDQVNSTSCVTWQSDVGPIVQEGVALHITPITAVTVTRNVWLDAHWVFNVHTWGGASPNLIGAFDLSTVFHPAGIERPLPWRVCARATGSTFEFKAWPLPEPEPLYGDTLHGGKVDLPAGYSHGNPGWYVGHVANSSQSATFRDLATS